ncbi:MRG-domain-containing protein [Tilletiopsis washingtonensis]|uniref:Chromatin modification-related protein EAF3 n=1 Tax=Tilletiopsis washingtonensis TaxID=58919 RepID=A0A316Z719_9BASI|nr:MRG-domain-containing protein [Tilletiopsis washingtonensis]PWN96758.1 MRG-domain-containing protein [Tilletiopsis washingtonensis]
MSLAFAVDEKVLCFHGPLIYPAKVLKAEKWTGDDNASGATGPHFRVHYLGWKQTWDEWVPPTRLLKHTDANLAKQRALQDAQRASNAAALAASSAGADATSSERAGEGRRRGRESTDTAGARKRKREERGTVEREEEYIKRPEIKIALPDALKLQLVDDWENVTKKNLLVPLPRTPSVRTILSDYRAFYLARKDRSSRSPSVLDEVLLGLTLYFDRSLGANLLYRFERAQYLELQKEHAAKKEERRGAGRKRGDGDAEAGEWKASDVYGAEHLLRLFVNLPGIIAHTTMDAPSVALLKEHLGDFLAYVAKEQSRLFTAYEAAPAARS